MRYSYDYILIGLVLIGSIILSVQTIIKRKGLNSYKYPFFVILGGLMIISIAASANSYFSNHWEEEYIYAFLMLKRVSHDWFFRHLCSLGYILLIFGITLFFVTVSNNVSNKYK